MGVDVTRWVREVETQGYVIIDGFLSPDEVAVQKAAMATVPVLQGGVGGNVHLDRTIRAHNLLGKTRACDHIVEDPRLLALVEGVLGDDIQVSVATLMDMLPGEREQNYHQDDRRYKLPRPHIPLVFNSIIALDEFTPANGATRLIPRSHAWGDGENAAMAAAGLDSGGKALQLPSGVSAQAVVAAMKPGSLLGFDGAIWHAGGASESLSLTNRLALNFVYCRGWLQQQENQLLGVASADVVGMRPRLQSLLGFDGSVDFVRGSSLLAAEVAEGRGLGAAVNRKAEPHAALVASLRATLPRL